LFYLDKGFQVCDKIYKLILSFQTKGANSHSGE
jgi:hypothetical protein